MFQGLYSFEKVLVVLGIALFVLLAVALLAYVFQKRELGTLLPFFLFPIVMIAFPGIKKLSYDDGKLELERDLATVERNPNDGAARAQLEATVEKLEPRTTSDPGAGVTVARAYQKLGRPELALRKLDSVLKADPTRHEAIELRGNVRRDLRRPP